MNVLASIPQGAKQQGENWRMICPVHGGSQQSLSIHTSGKVHCHAGCDRKAVETMLLDMGILRRDGPEREPPKEKRYWERYWNDARDTDTNAVLTYLRKRCITWSGPPVSQVLRWSSYKRAMVARFTKGTEWCGVHVTPLPSKDRRCHGRIAGSAIVLNASDCDLSILMVGEGIESTLSLAQMMEWKGRIWAASSAGMMERVALPADLEKIVIATDFDGAGILAAERLGRRAKAKGIQASMKLPKDYKMDWNDALQQMEA